MRGGLHVLPALLLLAVALQVGAPQFHVRPLVLTIGLLSVTFAWLVDVENGTRRPRRLCWLVPLFALWTNLHGGVLAGLGTLGLCVGGWCLAAACRLRGGPFAGFRGSAALLALFAASLAATLLNPYGLALPREWYETLTMPLPGLIVEHAPLNLAEPIGWATVALAVLYVAVLAGVPLVRAPCAAGNLGLRITWLVPLAWFAWRFCGFAMRRCSP